MLKLRELEIAMQCTVPIDSPILKAYNSARGMIYVSAFNVGNLSSLANSLQQRCNVSEVSPELEQPRGEIIRSQIGEITLQKRLGVKASYKIIMEYLRRLTIAGEI